MNQTYRFELETEFQIQLCLLLDQQKMRVPLKFSDSGYSFRIPLTAADSATAQFY